MGPGRWQQGLFWTLEEYSLGKPNRDSSILDGALAEGKDPVTPSGAVTERRRSLLDRGGDGRRWPHSHRKACVR